MAGSRTGTRTATWRERRRAVTDAKEINPQLSTRRRTGLGSPHFRGPPAEKGESDGEKLRVKHVARRKLVRFIGQGVNWGERNGVAPRRRWNKRGRRGRKRRRSGPFQICSWCGGIGTSGQLGAQRESKRPRFPITSSHPNKGAMKTITTAAPRAGREKRGLSEKPSSGPAGGVGGGRGA